MKKILYTTEGTIERELTADELKKVADGGDVKAKLAMIPKPLTVEERLQRLELINGV